MTAVSQIFQFGLTDAPNLTDLGLVLWPTSTAFFQQTDCPLPAITIMFYKVSKMYLLSLS